MATVINIKIKTSYGSVEYQPKSHYHYFEEKANYDRTVELLRKYGVKTPEDKGQPTFLYNNCLVAHFPGCGVTVKGENFDTNINTSKSLGLFSDKDLTDKIKELIEKYSL